MEGILDRQRATSKICAHTLFSKRFFVLGMLILPSLQYVASFFKTYFTCYIELILWIRIQTQYFKDWKNGNNIKFLKENFYFFSFRRKLHKEVPALHNINILGLFLVFLDPDPLTQFNTNQIRTLKACYCSVSLWRVLNNQVNLYLGHVTVYGTCLSRGMTHHTLSAEAILQALIMMRSSMRLSFTSPPPVCTM